MRKDASINLKKIFSLVPLLHANQGMHLSKLQKIAGYGSLEELRRHIHKLILFGVPPFSPSDFIEVYIDEEDRVYLEFPQGLDRPLALTAEEWALLQKVLSRDSGVIQPGQKGTDDLVRILSRLSAVPVAIESTSPFQKRRAAVEKALSERLQIQFLYRTLSSREPEIRRVDPWALFQHRGSAYLIGHCHLRKEPRYFHLERMDDVQILDMKEETSPPENMDSFLKQSPIFDANPGGFTVEIAFSPKIKNAMELYFKIFNDCPLQSQEHPEWLRASCRVRESLWFRSMMRSLGPDCFIVSPQHMRDSQYSELMEIAPPDSIDPVLP